MGVCSAGPVRVMQTDGGDGRSRTRLDRSVGSPSSQWISPCGAAARDHAGAVVAVFQRPTQPAADGPGFATCPDDLAVALERHFADQVLPDISRERRPQMQPRDALVDVDVDGGVLPVRTGRHVVVPARLDETRRAASNAAAPSWGRVMCQVQESSSQVRVIDRGASIRGCDSVSGSGAGFGWSLSSVRRWLTRAL